jgi:hypothetical protein
LVGDTTTTSSSDPDRAVPKRNDPMSEALFREIAELDAAINGLVEPILAAPEERWRAELEESRPLLEVEAPIDAWTLVKALKSPETTERVVVLLRLWLRAGVLGTNRGRHLPLEHGATFEALLRLRTEETRQLAEDLREARFEAAHARTRMNKAEELAGIHAPQRPVASGWPPVPFVHRRAVWVDFDGHRIKTAIFGIGTSHDVQEGWDYGHAVDLLTDGTDCWLRAYGWHEVGVDSGVEWYRIDRAGSRVEGCAEPEGVLETLLKLDE